MRDENHPEIFHCEMKLSRSPDHRWAVLVANPTDFLPLMTPLRVSGDSLLIDTTEAKMKQSAEWALKCVQEANDRYDQSVSQRAEAEKGSFSRREEEDKRLRDLEKGVQDSP